MSRRDKMRIAQKFISGKGFPKIYSPVGTNEKNVGAIQISKYGIEYDERYLFG